MHLPARAQLRAAALALLLCAAFAASCRKPETNVEKGNRQQVLHKGNGKEVQDLDPHIVNSVSSFNIITALLEGLGR
jgi:oligopeptide transport system substrate-binding protein